MMSVPALLASTPTRHALTIANQVITLGRLSIILVLPLLPLENVPCPLFENGQIVQQPADLLTLTETYINAATSFIKTKAGMGGCMLRSLYLVCI